MNLEHESNQVMLSEDLRRYLGDELEEGDPIPGIIQDILTEPGSTTGYANFCLKGPRHIQPYIIASAAVFNLGKKLELGMFSHAPPNERQSLYFYRNLIPTIELPDRVRKIDNERFFSSGQKLHDYQETSLFPKFREYRFPMAIMTFCVAIVEKPVDVIYLIHHSDVKAAQALGFLKSHASIPFSGE